jgi:hypothetical protein
MVVPACKRARSQLADREREIQERAFGLHHP